MIHNGNVVNIIMRSREITVKLNWVSFLLNASTIVHSFINLKIWIYSLHYNIIQES